MELRNSSFPLSEDEALPGHKKQGPHGLTTLTIIITGLYRGSDLGREFAALADLPDRLRNKIGVELSTAADYKYNIAVDV
jgi:hypothetical protein